MGVEPGEKLLNIVANCFEVLLKNCLVSVGDLVAVTTDERATLTVQPWALDPEDSVERIMSEWRDLDHLPDLNEICWFELTPKGRNVALALVGLDD